MNSGRKPMPKNEVQRRYALYKRLGSVAAAARQLGCSNSALLCLFRRRGLSVARYPGAKPFVEYAGRKFTIDTFGYFRETASRGKPKTPGVEVMLQRVVWEAHNGPIPLGRCVIFKDGNRLNCAKENLLCVSKSEAMSILASGRNQFTRTACTRLQVLVKNFGEGKRTLALEARR